MSGPIVRKYGFPNFEKIFGERDLKHGAEGETSTPQPAQPASEPAKPSEGPDSSKADPRASKP